MTRALLLSIVVFAFIGGIAFLACQSGAETPNAYFNHDGGPGDLGQICRSSNLCNDVATLVCVDDDGDTGPLAPVCRAKCVTTEADLCGDGFHCVGIRDATANEGACVPVTAGEGEGEGGEGEGEGEGEGGAQ